MPDHHNFDDQKEKWSKITNKRYLFRGFSFFVAISLLTYLGLFLYRGSADFMTVIRSLRPWYLAVLIVLVLADWAMGAMRNHIFAKRIKPDIPFSVTWDANLANIFVGAVTPSQSGGGPAQFYILYRNGISISDSLAISIVNYIATMTWLPAAAWLGLLYIGEDLENQMLVNLFRMALGLFGSILVIIFISLFLPSQMSKFVHSIARIFLEGSKINLMIHTAADGLHHYHKTIMDFLTGKWFLFPLSVIITVVMYSNKYFIAYIIMMGLGLEADLIHVMAVQAIIFFILYFAPSPGAAGIAEISQASLMISLVPSGFMSIFTAAQRVFTLMIPAVVGGLTLMRYLKDDTYKR